MTGFSAKIPEGIPREQLTALPWRRFDLSLLVVFPL